MLTIAQLHRIGELAEAAAHPTKVTITARGIVFEVRSAERIAGWPAERRALVSFEYLAEHPANLERVLERTQDEMDRFLARARRRRDADASVLFSGPV